MTGMTDEHDDATETEAGTVTEPAETAPKPSRRDDDEKPRS